MAARYLTVLPLGGRGRRGAPEDGPDELGRAAGWFPLVGLGMGVALAVLDAAVMRFFPPLLAALLTVTAWKLLSGGIHLDGLADCLDGLGGRDREHCLAIMRDSRIGTFGAIGLVVVLLLAVAALSEIGGRRRGRLLVAAPVLARAVPVVLARLFPSARPGGQGARFAAALRPGAVLLAAVVAAVVAVAALGPWGLGALGLAGLPALAIAKLMALRLGGVTGDVLGASVEVAELAVLVWGAAWTHARPGST